MMISDRAQQALKLESLRRSKTFEELNRAAHKEGEVAVGNMAARGVLQSGNTARALTNIQCKRAEGFALAFVEGRRETLKRYPELATPEQFSQLQRDVEQAIDGACNSVAGHVGRYVQLPGSATSEVARLGEGEADSLKARARRDIEIMKGEFELNPVSVEQRPVTRSSVYIVDAELIEAIAQTHSKSFDSEFLVKLCHEINSSFSNGSIVATTLLMRGVLNYVPPVFGHESFAQVTANASRSLKDGFEHLENGLRKIADFHTHRRIQKHETYPSRAQVEPFKPQFEQMLQEVLVRLKSS